MDYFVEFPEINLILKKIFVFVPLLALLRQSRHSDSTVKFLKKAVVGMLECMDGTFLLHFKYNNKVIIT